MTFFLKLLCLLAAGGAHAADSPIPAALPPQFPANFMPVPLMRQATSYSCGTVSLMSILYYNGKFDGREDELYSALGTTPAEGTRPDKIATVANSFGLSAEVHENMSVAELRATIDRGSPVILDIQAWRDTDDKKWQGWQNDWEDGHYVVAVAMDEKYIYAMDPANGANYAFLTTEEILDRWHDYDTIQGVRVEYHHLGIVFAPPAVKFQNQIFHID